MVFGYGFDGRDFGTRAGTKRAETCGIKVAVCGLQKARTVQTSYTGENHLAGESAEGGEYFPHARGVDDSGLTYCGSQATSVFSWGASCAFRKKWDWENQASQNACRSAQSHL